VLVSRGAVAEAEIVAREGVALADQTDALNHQAETAIAVAHALHAQGRRREARSWIERAIHLFERKGNVVSARRARTALEELAPA
jgi:hypothetical protein